MRKQFKNTLLKLAKQDKRIILLFGDISVYLFKEFQEKYPKQFYNLGICENTLISTAAGLSSQGYIPFVHTIAPFITDRSFEQIKLDLCYNDFPANIVTIGSTFDYAWDGPSHHTLSDIEMLRTLPNMEIVVPGSSKEADILIKERYNSNNTTYFRLSDNPHSYEFNKISFNKASIIKNNESKLTIMTNGPLLDNVYEACKNYDVNLVYFNTIKPIDIKKLQKFINTKILVISESYGLYEAITQIDGIYADFYGVKDFFYNTYGNIEDLRNKIGLDVKSIKKIIKKNLNKI